MLERTSLPRLDKQKQDWRDPGRRQKSYNVRAQLSRTCCAFPHTKTASSCDDAAYFAGNIVGHQSTHRHSTCIWVTRRGNLTGHGMNFAR